MKLSPVIVAFAAIAFTGCAGLNERQGAIDRLSAQVSELRASVDGANGRIDDLGNRLVLLHEKIESSRAELDKLRSGMAPVSPPEGIKVVPLTEEHLRYNPGPSQKAHTDGDTLQDATAAYNMGQDLFMAGRYDEARGVFASFLRSYPRHALSDNALYWIGEAYYSEKDFEKALEKFIEVADKYPEENKAPDALLKAGFSQLEMTRKDKAKEVLEKLISRYPKSDAASKAMKAVKGL